MVVPSTEEHFVESIQNEISEHSVKKVAKLFDDRVLIENEIAQNGRFANKLLDELEELDFISIDDEGMSQITLSKEAYDKQKNVLKGIEMKGVDSEKLKAYFDAFFKTTHRVKNKERRKSQKAHKIKINTQNFKKFQKLWESLNHEAMIHYEIDTQALIESAVASINHDFEIVGRQDIVIQTRKEVENLETHHGYDETVTVVKHSVFTLYEFVKSLSNSTKLSMNTIAIVLSKIDKEKFQQITSNENLALVRLKEMFIAAIYKVIVNKISYEIREVNVNNSAFIDKNGQLRDYLNAGALGREVYPISNKAVIEKSLYDENFMEVDSEIEKATIEESMSQQITVFGKLPSLKIPTPHGKSYSPDFAYVLDDGNQQELYLVVETKGYDSFSEIGHVEQLKIKSATRFFEALKEQKGVEVKFKTKINGDELSQMIASMGLR